jgi:hypothetical protein
MELVKKGIKREKERGQSYILVKNPTPLEFFFYSFECLIGTLEE